MQRLVYIIMSYTTEVDEYFQKRIYSINHPGIRQDEVIDGYKDWTQTYDQDLEQQDYNAPQNAASILNQHYPLEARKTLRILDVGAGTGLVADEIVKLGFIHIDALDPTKDMLDMARKKGLYEKYFQEFLSVENPTSIPSDEYDCVTAAGCFSDNHIPWNTIPELIRVVKPGGLIVISTKVAETDYYKGLDKLVDELVRDRKLSKVDRIKLGLYFKGTGGLIYVFTVF